MISPDYGFHRQFLDAPVAFDGGNVTDADVTNQTATELIELAQMHATMLGGIASGIGGDQQLQEIQSIRRPWLDEPDGSEPFDLQNGIALPAVGVTFSTVLTLVVPEGYDGVIKAFSWNFTGGGFVQFSGDIVVRILRNGAAIRNFDNILNEKGTLFQPRAISPIRIYSGQTITLVVNHAANALLVGDVVGGFVGYFYPSKG